MGGVITAGQWPLATHTPVIAAVALLRHDCGCCGYAHVVLLVDSDVLEGCLLPIDLPELSHTCTLIVSINVWMVQGPLPAWNYTHVYVQPVVVAAAQGSSWPPLMGH